LKRALAISLTAGLAVATPGFAQDESEGTRLERLIERSLSGAGTSVTVRGFSGALAGRTRMAQLTVADAEGIWLTIEDAVLDWNRLALLRGRLRVAELSADRIEVARRPVAGPRDPLTPEASGTALRLPELPVSIFVEGVDAGTVVLGPDVLGQPLTVSLEGRAVLDSGAGETDIELRRIDGRRGEIALEGSFSNATGELAVDLSFDEGQGGVAAGLLGLPGAPPLRLRVAGDGALDDFTADVSLATEGLDRLAGALRTVEIEGTRSFEAALGGDLRPLMEPKYHGFFGTRTDLDVVAVRQVDGSFDLSRLSIETEALALTGTAAIGPDGVPRAFDLDGTVAGADGAPLLLPLGGEETRIARADLDLAFDASRGDGWEADITVTGLEREGFRAESIGLVGAGTITAEPAVTAALDFRADALDFGNAEVRTALGEAVTGRAEIGWASGEAVEIGLLRIDGESYGFAAEGRIANLTGTLDIEGSARVRAERLDAFSGLADRPLAGRIEAALTGSGSVFSGLIDIRGTGTGADLAVGIAELDAYLAGQTGLELAARRTTEGIFLDTLRISGPAAEIAADGDLRTGAGRIDATARLGDIAPLAAGLSGPGEADLAATLSDDLWTWALEAGAMSAELDAEGTVTGALTPDIVTAAGTARVGDLAGFSDRAGRTLGGAVDAVFSARAEPRQARFRLDAEGRADDIATGIAEVDALAAGGLDFVLAGALDGDTVTIGRVALDGAALDLEASGTYAPGFRDLALDGEARLADISMLADGLSGPATLAARVTPARGADLWAFDARAEALGVTAAADGTLRDLAAVPSVEGRLSASVADLAPFGDIVGRPLGGAVDLAADGALAADLSAFDGAVTATARNLRTGIAPVDRLLAGAVEAGLDAARTDGGIEVRAASVESRLLTAAARGTLGESTAFSFDGRLADIAPFVSGFSGPVEARGRAVGAGPDRAGVEASVRGPAGAEAQLTGTVATSGADADLAISGAAPLGLLNDVIAPRALAGTARFDLRLDGPPGLSALSGRATTSGARLTAPLLDATLEDIAADVSLSGGRALVAIDSRFGGGGTVRLDGPVTLGGGFPADFDVALDRVRLTDPTLYRTSVDARLALEGPLLGGAQISGRVDVGETELRIPNGGGGRGGGLPDLTHIDEPAAVRTTRARAGLIREAARAGGGGSTLPFGLDVDVNAPNRVFVRGRGLDAELGGQVRIGGTTRDVAPAGRLDLIRGRLDILGRRLDLTEGAITLAGALDPFLRLAAETEVESTSVSIVVEGPASDPEVSFQSRPELPEDEVLALLLFGRGIETLSPLQIARLAAAVATLTSSGGGLLGGVREGIGLADLDVTTGEDGNTAVRAGAYIADNVYTDVTVDTEGEAEINLNLDLSRSVTVRGSTSNTGESGLGIFFERDY